MSKTHFYKIDCEEFGSTALITFKKKILGGQMDMIDLDIDLDALSQIDGYETVVVDFGNIAFIRMEAFHYLRCLKDVIARRNARLILCRVPLHIEIVCKFCKIDSQFEMQDELDIPVLPFHLQAA